MKKTEEIKGLYRSHVMPTYSQSLALVRGKGTKVWGADGKVYLDFTAGISVVNLGHCHAAVVNAIKRQVGELMHVSNLFYNENQAVLATKLSEMAQDGKCFFCNSGAEANEALIKIARKWGHAQGRYEIICMRNSFHGRTLATLTATGQDKVKKGFEPLPEGFKHAEFNDLASVEALVNDKTVAILLEAVQGEGGVIPATPEFLQGVRKLCDDKNLLMLCDEVQCGMGRTGHWFGFQAGDVWPDAFSLAKSLGNGYPVGAAVALPRCCDALQPGEHASTFGGGPVACAAALAVIETIERDNLIGAAARAGALLRTGLEALVESYEHVKEVRGAGLMLGLVLDQPAAPVVEKMREIGLLTLATAGNVIRILPPLTVSDDELEEALDIMDDVFSELHGGGAASGDEAGATAGAASAE